MVVIYPVIFTAKHDAKDTYLVEIPDIEGVTEGYGLKDAYEMARDYIGNLGLDLGDEEMPKASAIGDIDITNGAFTGKGETFVSLVDTDLDVFRRKANARAVRKNVSLPSWLSDAADAADLNISRVLQEALKEKLGIAE